MLELGCGPGYFSRALARTVPQGLLVLRVLKEGGTVTVAETRRDSDFIPLARLKDMFSSHHLDHEAHGGISLQYVARFRKRPLSRAER